MGIWYVLYGFTFIVGWTIGYWAWLRILYHAKKAMVAQERFSFLLHCAVMWAWGFWICLTMIAHAWWLMHLMNMGGYMPGRDY